LKNPDGISNGIGSIPGIGGNSAGIGSIPNGLDGNSDGPGGRIIIHIYI